MAQKRVVKKKEETRPSNFHLSDGLLLSTFERMVEMQTQVASDMKQLCDCMNKNTLAMGKLVEKLAPIAGNMHVLSKSVATIKHALLPVIVALVTTTLALLLKTLSLRGGG